MTLLKNHPKPITKEHLASLYTWFTKNGDQKQAHNLLDLYDKLENRELTVSFAGHFSAGKSSIINELLGKSLLPQSPIPTSANLVKIYSGNGYARVYFHHEETIQYSEPYDIDLIKKFCQDKDTIKKIEISSSESILPLNTALMDTPGIDAADDADRLITEGSLHQVDAMFYVMDYNHVQSEVNLQFLQAIQEKNIPFFLIINQIDKHDETELAFTTYQNKIKQTFNQWDIYPQEVFYTSLLDQSIENNQFQILKDFLFMLLTTKKENYYSMKRSIEQIINDHEAYLEDQNNEEIELIKAQVSDYDSVTERIDELNNSISKLTNRAGEFEKEFMQNTNTTLKNAYIMPAELREQASAYLESQQSDFKVGLFGTKKKREEERAIRRKNFLIPLQQNIEKSIQWKLRDKIVEQLKRYHISDPNLIGLAQDISIDYTEDNLSSVINPGAKVNGESVLNYTKDVSDDIKEAFKRKTIEVKNVILSFINEESSDQIRSYQNELNQLKKAETASKQITVLTDKLHEKSTVIQNILKDPQPTEEEFDQMHEDIQIRNKVTKQEAPRETVNNEKQVDFSKNSKIIKGTEAAYTVDNILQGIDQTLDVVDSVAGFEQIITDLKTKQQKLLNRSFTITLFGAFSAGKSSFANALIGESVLPVSPNPTTAAINRIVPVTEENKHGKVMVTMKDEKTIVQDCLELLKGLSPSSENLESLYYWLLQADKQSLSKTQQQYLQAILNGYETMKQHIGGKIHTNIDNFSVYVVEETKACFVESIDLYYDCSLTKQGITLVDTPGADSVNARHTNVAFDYIKHADAILYVTYYNHALSRADRDFLMQLGRVKESFELDKMFFIINAADLAKDEKELSMVENYVNEQLLKLGIRYPKLFPISSRKSLMDKQNKTPLNDYMYNFEEQFYQFIHHDLTKLSMDSALWDMGRAYNAISGYLASTQMSENEKIKQKESLREKQVAASQIINELDLESYKQSILQKIEKQLFYVLERLSIRFHDMFKEMFNPTTIQDSGKAGREQIQKSMEELLDYVGYELLQELRAVSLRVEAQIREFIDEVNSQASERINQIDHHFVLPSGNELGLTTPNFTQAFTSVEVSMFSKVLSSFKGTKSFFEKNEKQEMKEEIFTVLKPFAKVYLDENKQVMDTAYVDQWNYTMEHVKAAYIQSIDVYVNGLIEVLSDTDSEKELINKEKSLASILSNYNSNKEENYDE
ncbi:dynamin family protein [Virgibacillus sp. DJP39]|uniref:dynamin family protein n=1 Tax=Virgibacillus sp. DJP39 TaxID=3409790 RepID=UPI003BB5D09B